MAKGRKEYKKEQVHEPRGKSVKRKRTNTLILVSAAIMGFGFGYVLLISVQSNVTIKATWIASQVAGDTVSIPVREVENNKMTHFRVGAPEGSIAFMAYKVAGKLYVRANVCPPCKSIGFSLQRDILICDTCQTTFNAKTGDGIKGACVDFPKASIPYKIRDGNMVMQGYDIVTAYQNTIQPG